MNSLIKSFTLIALSFLTVACGSGDSGAGNQPQNPITSVELVSDEGDHIGSGGSYSYTNADAIIIVDPIGQYFTLEIDGNESWDGTFILPSAYTELLQGSYSGLTSYGSHDPAVGGIRWSGQGHSCTGSGWLIIDKATYAAETLTELEMQFEHRCGNDPSSPAMRGTIKWYADDITAPPGPVYPPPNDLWEPDPSLLPASGNYAYFDSEAGDPVASGFDYLFTEPDATFVIDSPTYNPWFPDPYLRVSVSPGLGSGWRDSSFQSMNTLTEIEPGYYGDVQRFPFHNVTKGGMEIGGFGSSCNSLRGWFVIDEIIYADNMVTSVMLRFEQRCEGVSGSLFGKIRWSQE